MDRTTTRIVSLGLGTLALIGGTSGARAQTGFAGVITFVARQDAGDAPSTIVQTTSGKKLRMDLYKTSPSIPDGAVIFDGDAHTTTILIPDQKKYFRSSPPAGTTDSGGHAAAAPAVPSAADSMVPTDITFSSSGRSEIVAGVSCAIYRVSSRRGHVVEHRDACIAPGVGFAPFDALTSDGLMGNAAATSAASQFGALLKGGKGIMKLTRIDSPTVRVVELVVTKIDRSSPPESAFQPPPGYTALAMPSFGTLAPSGPPAH
jgi:hypothetical protein